MDPWNGSTVGSIMAVSLDMIPVVPHKAVAEVSQAMRLAFDPTPTVSHLTLPRFWGRVECEKVEF